MKNRDRGDYSRRLTSKPRERLYVGNHCTTEAHPEKFYDECREHERWQGLVYPARYHQIATRSTICTAIKPTKNPIPQYIKPCNNLLVRRCSISNSRRCC